MIPLVCLWSSLLSTAQAQSAPTSAPSPEAPAEPSPPEPSPPEPAPAQPPPAVPAPVAPEPAPVEPEVVPPPPPETERPRYEGEVSSEGSAAPAYEEDINQGDQEGGSKFPGFSIRLDPFNWLIAGRLGLELEVVAWEFISVELVPIFVASTEPPAFNFSSREDSLSQHSNGIGPIAGASLGAGFWISGEPLRGYVLRAILTNYGYDYEAADSLGVFDRVTFTERRFVFYFGSHNRWGAFTIAGGLGLGYELNQQQRCIVNRGSTDEAVSTSGCPDDGEQHIKLDRGATALADINGPLHPVYLSGRISLGVSFD